MRRLGTIVLLTLLLAGCGQAAAKPGTAGVAQTKNRAPKIPHKVTEGMVCKDCHAKGVNGAPVSPHPNRENCTSCHQPK